MYVENERMKNKISETTRPPLKKPERPSVLGETLYGYDGEILKDLYIKKQFLVPEMPVLPPVVQPTQGFDHGAYMSGVFAYQRGNFKEALKLFSSMSFSQYFFCSRLNLSSTSLSYFQAPCL